MSHKSRRAWVETAGAAPSHRRIRILQDGSTARYGGVAIYRQDGRGRLGILLSQAGQAAKP